MKRADPWHMISGRVQAYNDHRRKHIAASSTKVFDESMSAFCPQSTKRGDLPNISYIKRKPEPLGTEFKVTCCSKTGKSIAL